MSRNIALFGMMGVGKTTVAVQVADRLGRQAVDTDDELRRWTGRTIPQLFEEFGESGFRELEGQVVAELARFQDLVLALGGGTVLRDDNVSALQLTGVLVELRADPATLAQRLRAGDQIADRPLLDGDDPVAALRRTSDERAERYAAVANVTIDADRPVDEVVEAILQWAMSCGDVLTPSEHEQVMT